MGYEDLEYMLAILSTMFALCVTVISGYMSRRISKNRNNLYKQKMELLDLFEDIKLTNHTNKLNKLYLNKDSSEAKQFDEKIEELIQNHHEQAIRQSVIQFWFSLIASVVGFVFIIVVVILSDNLEWYEYVIKILPGAIIEAVSVLFFSQSRETRERASDFLNRLREDRQFTKSIAIIDTLSDEKLKSLVKAEIALHLCGIKDIDVITEKIKTENRIEE